MPVPYEPVSVEDLTRLRELLIARDGIASRLLDMDLERISTLAAARRVTEEHDVLFRRLMSERGIADGEIVDINPRTGEVVPRVVPKEEPAPQQEAPAT